MENYRVGVGHDVDTELLVLLNPQPRGDGAIPVDRKYGLTGTVYDDQLYTILHFDFTTADEEYWDMLAVFGINVNPSSPITLMARDIRFVERKFNGVAQLPEPNSDIRQDNFFLTGVNVFITHLQEINE